jgi:hypothetical protein
MTFKLGEYCSPLIDFKKMVKDKAVTGNTIVFNNLINIQNIMNRGNWLLIVGIVAFFNSI